MIALRPSLLSLLVPLLLASAQASAQAPVQPSGQIDAGLATRLQDMARSSANAVLPIEGARVEVILGEINPHLRLAACKQIQPYLLPALPMWGRTRLGLRCLEGPTHWNVSLPLTVKVYAKVLVAGVPLPSGAQLTATELTLAETDIAAEPGKVFISADALAGRRLARPLQVGEALRSTDLEKRRWFAAGEEVNVRASGVGFAVSGEGQALSAGIEGEDARIRLDNGRIVVGRPVGDRLVEVML